MLAKLGDWRSITDTPRWSGTSQNNVANTVGEKVSVKSLLQIVGVEDIADVPNAAQKDEHATGVILADGTPAMAYSATVDENSFSITFDQPVRENSDNLTIFGAYDNYTITYTSGTKKYNVYRHSTDYIDPFGATITATTPVEIAVSSASFPFGSTNSHAGGGQLVGETVTYTLADNATHDFSGYFAAIGHNANVTDDNATDTTDNATYYVTYDYVEDTNFNSWAASVADDFDVYDSGSTAIANYAVAGGPRLIGDDDIAPKLVFGPVDNDSGIFLIAVDSPGFSLTNAHVTASNDNDTEFSIGAAFLAVDADNAPAASTDNDSSGYVTFVANGTTTLDDQDDFPLFFTWNSATSSDRSRIPDNSSDYDRAVLKFSKKVTAVNGARVYYYKETTDNVTANSIFTSGLELLAGGEMDTVESDNQTVGFSEDGSLVVRFPDLEETFTDLDNETVASHKLIIDNVTINGVEWVLQIAPPASTVNLQAINDGDMGSTYDDADGLPTVTYFRKAYLPYPYAGVQTGDEVNVNSLDNDTVLMFSEHLSAATLTVTEGTNYDDNKSGIVNTNGLFSFVGSVADPTVNDNGTSSVTVTLEDDSAESSGSKVIGHNAGFTLSVTDMDGNSSSVSLTLKRGHGADIGDNRAAVLNVIDGNTATGINQ
jgi:hypothetical protein